MLDAVGRLGCRRHRNLNRVPQQFAGERANVGGHRCGEEEVLPLPGQFPHDATNWLDEAEVEHLIDFVEHQKFDRVETRDAGVEMIEKPAGRRNQHIEAGLKRAYLSAMRHAAEDDCDLQPQAVRKVAEALGDLACEFASGAQHEHARAASGRWAPVGHDLVEDRQRKGRGFARACLSDANQIPALHQGRDGLDLNWGRTREAKLGQRCIKGRGEAEPVEIIQGGSLSKCRGDARRAYGGGEWETPRVSGRRMKSKGGRQAD